MNERSEKGKDSVTNGITTRSSLTFVDRILDTERKGVDTFVKQTVRRPKTGPTRHRYRDL